MDTQIRDIWPIMAALGSFGSLLVTVFLTIHSFRSKKLEKINTDLEDIKKTLKEGFDKNEVQFNEIKTSIHKLDIRLVTIETENRMIQWPMVVNEDIVPKRRPGRPRRVLTHKEN